MEQREILVLLLCESCRAHFTALHTPTQSRVSKVVWVCAQAPFPLAKYYVSDVLAVFPHKPNTDTRKMLSSTVRRLSILCMFYVAVQCDAAV